ncbi:iron complex transport system ATP-binding protein [Alkalispirochaeta americana]|uniref:Iron complex transport system ATP-binding protein n=1 Tax=Alkalispirochaeta americana TaxID=159291 RepID=A0A1N6PV17_9SPIO|nr:ABC transporter ATP-binding protein [Alkalispirochaeta americana]SIQ08204.1 iron complex transport system ATP-binding protein [Alkalispirochaeta americana]
MLHDPGDIHVPESREEPLLFRCRDISFSYGRKNVLHQISLSAGRGEIIGLLGPNGCGKSTLLRCIAGVLKSHQGSLHYGSSSKSGLAPRERARHVSFLPQHQLDVPGITVRKLVILGRNPYSVTGWHQSAEDRRAVHQALEQLQLLDLQHKPLDQLSGGERQRAWIAMTIAQDTPLILLDEPVSYLDLRHQWAVLEVLTELKRTMGKTLIAVFHDVNHAMAVCDRVYVMKEGRIYSRGCPESVLNEDCLQEVYGVRTCLCSVGEGERSVVVPLCPCKMRRTGPSSSVKTTTEKEGVLS